MAIETPRSGDLVLTTAERLAPLMALIAPFIDGGVDWLQAHLQYTVLGDNYAAVLQSAIASYAPILLARRTMRRIRTDDALAALTAPRRRGIDGPLHVVPLQEPPDGPA